MERQRVVGGQHGKADGRWQMAGNAFADLSGSFCVDLASECMMRLSLKI